MSDLFVRILTREPTPPRSLDPTIPADLEAVCLRALERDPGRRFPTAAELALELTRHFEGHRVATRPTSLTRRALDRIRRRSKVALPLATGTALCGLALAILLTHRDPSSEAPDRAAIERSKHRLVWSGPDGQAIVWEIDPRGTWLQIGAHGPVPDARVESWDEPGDGAARILWTTGDLWIVDATRAAGGTKTLPARPGSSVVAYRERLDGTSRSLWTGPGSRAGIGAEALDAIRLVAANLPGSDPNEIWRRPAILAGGDRLVLDSIVETERRSRRRPLRTDPEAARRRLREILGLEPLPDRTPLGAVLHSVTEREGVRIERVSFESRPGFVVTANVYLPSRDGPFPAVASPVGHWPAGKSDPVVHARGLALARVGFLCLVYDPAGQGERAVPGNGHGAHFAGVLAGRSNLTYMVWDTIRALDYLESRADVDRERIAATGESGGGINTLFASAVEPRIRASVPVVYVCRYHEFLATGHGHCPCNHVPGVAAEFDHADLLALIAPRPVLVLSAVQDDIFPVDGAHKAVEEARARLGQGGGEIEYAEDPGGHDFGRDLRIAMVDFLSQRFLRRRVRDEVGSPLLAADDPALRVFASGLPAEGRRTMLSMNREAVSAALAASPGWTRDSLVAWLGWEDVAFEGALEPVDGSLEGGRRWRIAGAPPLDPDLPLVNFEGDAASERRVLVVDSAAGIRGAIDAGVSRVLGEHGLAAVLVDVSGSGDLAFSEHVLATDQILLGSSGAGRMARDVARALAALDPRPAAIYARGVDAGLAVLLAAVATRFEGRVALDGAEAVLQVRAAYLSKDDRAVGHYKQRPLPRAALRGGFGAVA